MKRAFASLNPREALHTAIFIEERNAGLYHRLAEMFAEFRDSESLEVARVFWEMAAEEKQHSSILQSKYTNEFGSSSCALTDEDLLEMVEVPRLSADDILAGEGSRRDARERALQVALDAEMEAHRFYLELLENTPAGPLLSLYRELADMEDGHVAYIHRKLVPHSSSDKSVQ